MKYLEITNELFKFLLLICAVITCFELVKISKKTLFEKSLFITVTFSILDIFSNYFFITYLKSEKMFASFASINQYFFYLFEISTIILFYKDFIGRRKNLINTLIIFTISLIITFAFFTLNTIDATFITFTFIVIFELLFINYSFGYFLHVNVDKEYSPRTNRLIAINNGLFIFVNFITPFYFISIYLSKQNSEVPDLSFINYIGYIILYSSIIKSLKWKT